MKKYDIVIQKIAELDLDGIVEYIYNGLHERRIAFAVYKRITENICSLKEMPKRCSVIDEEPYKTLGTRRLIVDNYSMFYYVDDETMTIYILRILYNHRDWQSII